MSLQSWAGDTSCHTEVFYTGLQSINRDFFSSFIQKSHVPGYPGIPGFDTYKSRVPGQENRRD